MYTVFIQHLHKINEITLDTQNLFNSCDIMTGETIKTIQNTVMLNEF